MPRSILHYVHTVTLSNMRKPRVLFAASELFKTRPYLSGEKWRACVHAALALSPGHARTCTCSSKQQRTDSLRFRLSAVAVDGVQDRPRPQQGKGKGRRAQPLGIDAQAFEGAHAALSPAAARLACWEQC